jgi:hypothetical protein
MSGVASTEGSRTVLTTKYGDTLHRRRDCPVLRAADATIVEKDLDALPPAFRDWCVSCTDTADGGQR